jgi:cyclopropane fatty-acyl-phospholipid synthase-like methyltransferase
VLRACARLLRPGGRLAYSTIFVAPDLPPSAHRRAVAAGPPAPTTPDLAALTARAGFTDVAVTDRTDDYLATARAWLAARQRHRDALRPLDPDDYDDRVTRGRGAVAAIEAGLLRRAEVVAVRR